MSYHWGLGATPGRPSWCPATTLDAENPPKDPCEIAYSLEVPIVGRTTMRLPISQMTNDAIITAEQQLPGLLDRQLPMVWQKLAPYIFDVKSSIIGDLEYWLPEQAQALMDDVVLPEWEAQKDSLVADMKLAVEKALLGAALLGGAGLGVWWLWKRRKA